MADLRMSGMSGIPFGDTSSRPSSPAVGQTYYNGTLGYLEIYTASGWIPATGANDFNLNITASVTTITFTQSYSAGSYSIVSLMGDNTMDIYAYASDGSLAGYTNSKSFSATQRFNKMVILGGSVGDVLSFSYKTTFTTSSTNNETSAAAFITSISVSSLPNQNDTTVITGGNFASNVAVTFTGTGYSATAAKSIVRSSSTSLIVTRPDNFPVSASPYTITVYNPSVSNLPTGTNSHILSNSVTAGSNPSWTTSASQTGYYTQQVVSLQLVAADADSGITYSSVSGSLPTGLSLASNGLISGTIDTNASPAAQTTSYTYTVRATDSGGNYVDRTFTFSVIGVASSGVALWDAGNRTSGMYPINTSNGIKMVYVDLTTTDATTGKAGWMLAGSWSQASKFLQQATSTASVLDGSTPANAFSCNFGTMNVNFVRSQVSSSISNTGSNATSADFYYYNSTATPWRQWWVSDSSNTLYTSTTVNNSASVPRDALKQFTNAYNLKFGYSANSQVWVNLSDGGGRQGDWWNGLTGTPTAIGWNLNQDGSFSIIPSGDGSTGAGQDCNFAQTKFGMDDGTTGGTPNVAYYGSSATSNMNNNIGTNGSDTNLWLWIK